MSRDAKVVLALGVFVTLCIAALCSRLSSDVERRGGDTATMSEAPPVLSAPPLDVPSPSVSAPSPPREPLREERAPSQRLGPDALVRALVGRWRSEDGVTVEIEPPRDVDHDKRTPPYKLVFRGIGMPRSGYGCEFAILDSASRPPAGDPSVVYYAAWCGPRGKKLVALSLDIGLSVVVLGEGRVVHRADQLSRVESDRKPSVP